MDKKQREKFVVRFDDDKTRKAIEKVADEQHISMNAFILQAIDEKLGRGARIEMMIEAAGRTLSSPDLVESLKHGMIRQTLTRG